MIEVGLPSSDLLEGMLRSHPRVRLSDEPGPSVGLAFRQGSWERTLGVDDPTAEVFGLVELADNNPMVCADRVAVPSPEGTLALVALGAVIRAGMAVEAPTLLYSAPVDPDAVGRALATEGDGECVVGVDPRDLGRVLAVRAMVAIPTPGDWMEIDELFAEAFGRSFYVREMASGGWDTELVAGGPRAVYRLAYTPDEPTSLLTVEAMADRDGKLGAAQLVHAMNVMAGFEESLGIPDTLGAVARDL